MDRDQLRVALIAHARGAPTDEANRLLRWAAELERTVQQSAFDDRRRRRPRPKVVEFRSGGKGYRTRAANERRRCFGVG